MTSFNCFILAYPPRGMKHGICLFDHFRLYFYSYFVALNLVFKFNCTNLPIISINLYIYIYKYTQQTHTHTYGHLHFVKVRMFSLKKNFFSLHKQKNKIIHELPKYYVTFSHCQGWYLSFFQLQENFRWLLFLIILFENSNPTQDLVIKDIKQTINRK